MQYEGQGCLAEPRGIEGTMVMPPSSRGHPSCHRQLDLMGSIPLFSAHPIGSLLSGAVEPRGFEDIMVMPPSSRGHPSCHWQLDLMGSIPLFLAPP